MRIEFTIDCSDDCTKFDDKRKIFLKTFKEMELSPYIYIYYFSCHHAITPN